MFPNVHAENFLERHAAALHAAKQRRPRRRIFHAGENCILVKRTSHVSPQAFADRSQRKLAVRFAQQSDGYHAAQNSMQPITIHLQLLSEFVTACRFSRQQIGNPKFGRDVNQSRAAMAADQSVERLRRFHYVRTNATSGQRSPSG